MPTYGFWRKPSSSIVRRKRNNSPLAVVTAIPILEMGLRSAVTKAGRMRGQATTAYFFFKLTM